MKNLIRKTKQSNMAILSLIIIAIMFVSILSYAVMNVLSQSQSGEAQLKGFVLRENITEDVRSYYVSRGLTFLELHYGYGADIKSIEDFPNQFMTPKSQIQLIIIEVPDYERSYAIAESLNGIEEINSTELNQLAKGICNVLLYPPVECILGSLNMTQGSVINISNSS